VVDPASHPDTACSIVDRDSAQVGHKMKQEPGNAVVIEQAVPN